MQKAKQVNADNLVITWTLNSKGDFLRPPVSHCDSARAGINRGQSIDPAEFVAGGPIHR
jgi:hypothetical protein